MFIGFFIFTFLGFYLEKVLPNTYGLRLHPCFCFLPSTYCRKKRNKAHQTNEEVHKVNKNVTDPELVEVHVHQDELELKGMESRNLEPVSDDLKKLEDSNQILKI